MFISENNNQEYEVCYTQGKMMEDIQKILDCNNKIKTINGEQIFFLMKCGESEFKISIEKINPPKSMKFGEIKTSEL